MSNRHNSLHIRVFSISMAMVRIYKRYLNLSILYFRASLVISWDCILIFLYLICLRVYYKSKQWLVFCSILTHSTHNITLSTNFRVCTLSLSFHFYQNPYSCNMVFELYHPHYLSHHYFAIEFSYAHPMIQTSIVTVR
jgi:hypothetical protein